MFALSLPFDELRVIVIFDRHTTSGILQFQGVLNAFCLFVGIANVALWR
jgi:hypothetical protein